MMKLYIVRHGQTEANVNRLFNGRNQKDLTDFGIEQAERLASQLKNLKIDSIKAMGDVQLKAYKQCNRRDFINKRDNEQEL